MEHWAIALESSDLTLIFCTSVLITQPSIYTSGTQPHRQKNKRILWFIDSTGPSAVWVKRVANFDVMGRASKCCSRAVVWLCNILLSLRNIMIFLHPNYKSHAFLPFCYAFWMISHLLCDLLGLFCLFSGAQLSQVKFWLRKKINFKGSHHTHMCDCLSLSVWTTSFGKLTLKKAYQHY